MSELNDIVAQRVAAVIEAALHEAWARGYRAAEAFWTEGTGRLPVNPYEYAPPVPVGSPGKEGK